GVATGHSTVNAVESRIFTFSLKLIVMFVLVATWVAPLVGIVVVTAGGVSMVKAKTKLAAMLSGGSSESWSVTCAAKIVTVQVSPAAKSAFGLIVKADGPPVTTVSATFRVPLVVQTIWNQFPVTLTGSLNVTSMFLFVS